jgi:hypothetical protein
MTRPDFIAAATHTLADAQEGDTVIVAVLRPKDSMVMHTSGLDPFLLVDAARSLLEQAEDALQEAMSTWEDHDQGDAPEEQLLSSVLEALESLPARDEEA